MITIRMNDAAAQALQLLAPSTASDIELSDDLRAMLAAGLTRNDGALVFVINDRGGAETTAGARQAMARMGWDITQYECQASSFHLEDHARVTVDRIGDEPHIAHADRILLLKYGLLVADGVVQLVRALPRPVSVRCIISAGPNKRHVPISSGARRGILAHRQPGRLSTRDDRDSRLHRLTL